VRSPPEEVWSRLAANNLDAILPKPGIQLEKLVTIRLRLLDREVKVLFHFQVSREAFGTHSSGKEKP
jgi:hypothetical protein